MQDFCKKIISRSQSRLISSIKSSEILTKWSYQLRSIIKRTLTSNLTEFGSISGTSVSWKIGSGKSFYLNWQKWTDHYFDHYFDFFWNFRNFVKNYAINNRWIKLHGLNEEGLNKLGYGRNFFPIEFREENQV